jgi:hypothetical protein
MRVTESLPARLAPRRAGAASIAATMSSRAAGAVFVVACVLAPPLTAQDSTGAVPPASPTPSGRIAGRVIDRDTGRPLPGARIDVVAAATQPALTTDLDGRYRTEPLPVGIYAIRATYIGYQAARIDSVAVAADRTELVNVALKAVPFELSAIEVEAQAAPRPSSEAGLLSMQQSAPVVSDGISAEAMKRTPDAHASDALVRVTGISVVEGKFVVVRGLPERYSNTLLNGAELVSTEPVKRIVPLDIFPASLLESIVTMKTASPDRPGDFAGGSVAITTKEFPEQFVLQGNLSQGYNSKATFRSVPLVRSSFGDLLGFDNGRRRLPAGAPAIGVFGSERFAESIRNVWTPAAREVRPDLGLGFNIGGQGGSDARRLGYVFSWTYANRTTFNPDRLYFLYPDANTPAFRSLRFNESHAGVEWGAVFNVALSLGSSSKLGWKNLYTRQAQEDVVRSAGFETVNNRVTQSYQVRYVSEQMLQTQLTGDHQVGFLNSRFEWKGTLALAGRDEPDNRQAVYSSGQLSIGFENPTLWTRFLDDRLHALQADWSIPISLRQAGDALVKFGGLYRRRARDFDSRYFEFRETDASVKNDPVLALPPEQAFAPENIGRVLQIYSPGGHAEPYGADDDVDAAFVMVDVPVIPRLRLVGGVRYEDWRLRIVPGGRGSTRAGGPGSQRAIDWLWSFNGTLRLSERMNLRFAGFRSVARPDAREVTANVYQGVVGECAYAGNLELVRTWINNGDVRWELYPRPGELFAVSAFYKGFHSPIVETASYPDGSRCLITYRNAIYAQDYGLEIEARKSFGPFGISANFTRVKSRVEIPTIYGHFDPDLTLQGQSPWLANGMLSYGDSRVNGTLSFNFFSERVARYGFGSEALPQQSPSLVERGRATVDAKVQLRLPPHTTLTVAGKNLTNRPVEFIHHATAGTVLAQYSHPGFGLSLGMGYAF